MNAGKVANLTSNLPIYDPQAIGAIQAECENIRAWASLPDICCPRKTSPWDLFYTSQRNGNGSLGQTLQTLLQSRLLDQLASSLAVSQWFPQVRSIRSELLVRCNRGRLQSDELPGENCSVDEARRLSTRSRISHHRYYGFCQLSLK
jgi:hypothetical protein